MITLEILKTVLAAGSVAFAMGQEDPTTVVSNCQAADYVMDQGHVLIQPQRGSFSPKCVKVPRGTVVTLQGSSIHPVQAQAPIRGVKNPFETDGGSTQPITRTLMEPGYYGYYCIRHGDPSGNGMAGAILVE